MYNCIHTFQMLIKFMADTLNCSSQKESSFLLEEKKYEYERWLNRCTFCPSVGISQ